MLLIDEKAREEMIRDAVETYPDECCGFMFGTETGEDRKITEIRRVINAKQGDKKRRYEISPYDYLEAERYAIEKDMVLLGIYHSHPNHPAIASETDRLAAQPFFSYLILSVVDGSFAHWRSWRLNDSFQFEEEKVNEIQPSTIVNS